MSIARILGVSLFLILVIPMPSNATDSYTKNEENRVIKPYDTTDKQLLMEDDFSRAPIGLNQTFWNISMLHDAYLSWIDGERIGLHSQAFSRLTLKSSKESQPTVLAEFNLSFTCGRSYFAAGWSDSEPPSSSPWISNLRRSHDGVFIDFWDGQLYLVAYANGSRTATAVDGLKSDTIQNYRLLWTESLVTLYIDGEKAAWLSMDVPRSPLPFVFTISGHDYRASTDLLSVDYFGLFTMFDNETVESPEINLLWPENNSQISQGELVDFEIRGSFDLVKWGWNDESKGILKSPWDIPTSRLVGNHTLTIILFRNNTVQRQETFSFSIVPVSQTLDAWKIDFVPRIDGSIDSRELQSSCMHKLTARGEDRNPMSFPAYIGFYDSSLYIALQCDIPDEWHTRVSLLLDMNSNGKWDCNTPEDIMVTVASPSAYQEYSRIQTATGRTVQRTEFPGLVYAAGTQGDSVCTEFFVPFGNDTSEVAFAILIVQGGYEISYPSRFDEESEFTLNQIHRTQSPAVLGHLFGYLGFLMLFAGITYVAVLSRMREGKSLRTQLSNEQLERLRTLLLSYPEIDRNRITQMMEIDDESLSKNLDLLASRECIQSEVVERARKK